MVGCLASKQQDGGHYGSGQALNGRSWQMWKDSYPNGKESSCSLLPNFTFPLILTVSAKREFIKPLQAPKKMLAELEHGP